MPAPSKNWTEIADSQLDSDSPIDSTLMTQIRDNLAFLKDWMGGAYAANAQNPHDHDGVNSASVVLASNSVVTSKIADANVTLAKLKMAQGSWSTSVSGIANITATRYSHWPRIRSVSDGSGGGASMEVLGAYVAVGSGDSGTADIIRIQSTVDLGGDTNYVYWDYHTN